MRVGNQRIFRNPDEAVIAGVCSGFAEYLGVHRTLVRIGTLLILPIGVGGILYVIAWTKLREKPVTVTPLAQTTLSREVR